MAKKNIIEKLEAKGMNENAIKSFIGSIMKAYKQKKLDKLTNDPEYQALLKRYNLKPIDWTKNYDLSDLPAFRKNK